MKVNKTILVGFLFLLIGAFIFVSDLLNPLIRPVTHLFLMGSSKGKDIIFFGLLGLLLILSQVIPRKIDATRYLKISIVIGFVLLVFGNLLEVVFRLQMGIKLNTVFCSMSSTMSSTSILHTHLLKSILGEVLTKIIGPFIQSNINTGVGLYAYVPDISFLVVLIIPILFITLILANQKRPWFTNFLIAFFSSCLLIGSFDGGLWATPSLVGLLGLWIVYRNGYYLNLHLGKIIKDKKLLKANENIQPSYRNIGLSEAKYLFNRFLPILIILIVIALRFTVAFAGAEPDYYTVEIVNMTDNVDFGDIPIEKISNETYHVDSNYNEMELINDLKVPLNNSCKYYTVSWNAYSYL
ncbi:hypothetical protein SAMN05216439_1562 [Methanobrevibacter gottschalkii]|uniref:Uncharacterized protein n=2 Tax=Methanobrevibacter gottschalkii TaxID=190974 RepID=A0A3N5AZN9_9EURY|nr:MULTISPECIES: hypothetical protein [Methanobrevibacter]RPF50433.1 hypothetical protein EDC42_1710 [Methanobrevibacter gottschalkii DSM 11977]SEK85278.1 hypothetical protein SAMN05216439_1562 [Methanobrevibacter gottschalkii]